jgi:tetratricopeptide (TPR) repeat protein
MIVTKKRRFCLLLAGMLVASTPALAATGSDEAAHESRLHFDRGVELYRAGSLDAALAEFTRAFELTNDYRLLFNLAQVEAERHDYARAMTLLAEYLERGGDSLERERRAEVERELDQLRQRIATLWVTADVAGAEVWVGQHLMGQLPLWSPIAVNAGPTTIRVVKAGYKPVVRELVLAGGERSRLELALVPDTKAPGLTPESTVDHTWFWASASATAVLATGAAIFGVLAAKANTKLDGEFTTYPSSAVRIADARSSLRTDALAADVLAGAALVSAGASLYFLLSEGAGNSSPSGQGAGARLVPGPTGLWLDGTF